jgi:hypothetical protein
VQQYILNLGQTVKPTQNDKDTELGMAQIMNTQAPRDAS